MKLKREPFRSGFPGSSAGKESACNAGDPGLIPGLEDALEKGYLPTPVFLGFSGGSDSKESACSVETWAVSLDGKIPWRRAWQATPRLLPGDFHGQRSLVGYCPWSCKELDMTERLSTAQLQIIWTAPKLKL